MRHYSEKERQFIRDNLHLTNEEISKAIGRSKASVTWQLTHLKINRGGKKWSKKEVNQIRKYIRKMSRKDIATKLGVTEGSIKAVMKTNGIKSGRTGRFNPGNIPWCKGKSMPDGWGGATKFKKGQLPHNTKADGEISIRNYKGGIKYKWIRISQNRWEQLSRYNFKKFIGPIPHGFYVEFKDNNSLNCNPENLVLRSKQEHMARNTIARFPPELISTIYVLNKFKRKIKSYAKEQN